MKVDEARNSIFAMVFLLAQRWQVLGDQQLVDDGLTTKQWLLLATLGALPQEAPSLNELTAVFGTSRQNVKQLALKLEKRGFLEILNDPADRRILRFRITTANQEFWSRRAAEDSQFIAELFQGIPEKKLTTTLEVITSLLSHTEEG
jgi:DNA-binding MarR family transcriptional regulator